MGKHTFIDLPDEAILHAMSFLDPQTLSRSQQVIISLPITPRSRLLTRY